MVYKINETSMANHEGNYTNTHYKATGIAVLLSTI